MKKYLLIIVALFAISFASIAASIDSSSVKASSPTQDTSFTQGKALLEKVVVGTGDAIKTAYDVVVQQQRVYSVAYSVVGIVCLIFIFLFARTYKKSTEEGKKNLLFTSLLYLGIAVWTGIVFSLHYMQIIQGIVNPDYAAIQDVITMFKKLK